MSQLAVSSDLAWITVLLMICGVVSAVLARISHGTRLENVAVGFFFLLMLLMGIATFVALLAGPGHGLIVGSVLAVMAVMAVFDCGGLSKSVVA